MRNLMIMGALLWSLLSFGQTFDFACAEPECENYDKFDQSSEWTHDGVNVFNGRRTFINNYTFYSFEVWYNAAKYHYNVFLDGSVVAQQKGITGQYENAVNAAVSRVQGLECKSPFAVDYLLSEVAALGTNVMSWSGTRGDFGGPNPDPTRQYTYAFTSDHYDETIRLVPQWSSGTGVRYIIEEEGEDDIAYFKSDYVDALNTAIQKVINNNPLSATVTGTVSGGTASRNPYTFTNNYVDGGNGSFTANVTGLRPGETVKYYEWYRETGGTQYNHGRHDATYNHTGIPHNSHMFVVITTSTDRTFTSPKVFFPIHDLVGQIGPNNKNNPNDDWFVIDVSGLAYGETVLEVHWGINVHAPPAGDQKLTYPGNQYLGISSPNKAYLSATFDNMNAVYKDNTGRVIPGNIIDASVTTNLRKIDLHFITTGAYELPGDKLSLTEINPGVFRLDNLAAGESVTGYTLFYSNGTSKNFQGSFSNNEQIGVVGNISAFKVFTDKSRTVTWEK